MKKTLSIFAVIMIFTASILAQGFKVKATGDQTITFEDNKNQATFFSTTPVEDITGLSNDVKGSVTFSVNDVKTLKGKVRVSLMEMSSFASISGLITLLTGILIYLFRNKRKETK